MATRFLCHILRGDGVVHRYPISSLPIYYDKRAHKICFIFPINGIHSSGPFCLYTYTYSIYTAVCIYEFFWAGSSEQPADAPWNKMPQWGLIGRGVRRMGVSFSIFFSFWQSYQGYRKRAQLFALITAAELGVFEGFPRGCPVPPPPVIRCSLPYPPLCHTPFPESEDCSWPLLTFLPAAQVLENIFKFSSVAISQPPSLAPTITPTTSPLFTVVPPPSHLFPQKPPRFTTLLFTSNRHKHIMYSIWVRVLCAQLHFY